MTDEIEIEFKDRRTGKEYRLKGKPEVVDSYLKRFDLEDQIKNAAPVDEGSSSTEVPAVGVQNPGVEIGVPDKPEANSMTEYITKIINSEWALNGRTSTEILEVAKAHGIASLKLSTLASILVGLTNTTKIRRKKQAGDPRWIYYPSMQYAMSRHQ